MLQATARLPLYSKGSGLYCFVAVATLFKTLGKLLLPFLSQQCIRNNGT
jgi:hypothetical protein